jgi:hypothetical protein
MRFFLNVHPTSHARLKSALAGPFRFLADLGTSQLKFMLHLRGINRKTRVRMKGNYVNNQAVNSAEFYR